VGVFSAAVNDPMGDHIDFGQIGQSTSMALTHEIKSKSKPLLDAENGLFSDPSDLSCDRSLGTGACFSFVVLVSPVTWSFRSNTRTSS
jgi:hypothetical protein